MTTKASSQSKTEINRQREAVLRFYAAITNAPYDDVVNEYLGKPVDINEKGLHLNRLYPAVEMAVAYMNEEES